MTVVVIEAAAARPTRPLRHLVAAYHGYRERGVPPALHRGLPSPYLTVIFTLDEPVHVIRHVDPGQPPGDYTTLVGGLHTAPALVTHDGAQSGIQLLMRPLAARALLGVPAGELAGVDLDGTHVLGPWATRLQERLQAAVSWPERFALLDAALLARADEGVAVPDALHEAYRRIMLGGGAGRVRDLAREVGWSGRRLEQVFGREVGLGPKVMMRVVRFDRARRMVQARPGMTLAEIAARCGYFDQAHFARESAEFAGCAPSQLSENG